MVGDHAEDHIGFLAHIAALAVEHCHATIHLGKDGVPDLLGFLADDLDFSTAGAEEHDLLENHGDHQDQADTVEQILHGVKQHLQKQNAEVKGSQRGGHRNPEELLQHQGRDIHAAGGSAGPHHKAQTNGKADACKEHIQDHIVGDVHLSHDLIQTFQNRGEENGTENGGHGKALAQHDPANGQHYHIEQKNEYSQRNAGEFIDYQANARGTAAHQVGRQHKQLYRKGLQEIAQDHHENRQQSGDRKTLFGHKFPPFVKNTSVSNGLTDADPGATSDTEIIIGRIFPLVKEK